MFGIEHDQVDDRRARRHHDVALPIGDLAVGELEQHFEAALGRAGQREAAHQPAGQDGALDAAAKFEKTPAGKPGHVFLRQSGERGDDPQRGFDPLDDRAFGGPDGKRHGDHGGEIVDRPPRVRREAVADD